MYNDCTRNVNMVCLPICLLQQVLHFCDEDSADIISYQLKLTKMRAELADLNHCAVLFLSRAAVNLRWYYYTYVILQDDIQTSYFNMIYNIQTSRSIILELLSL